MLSFDVLVIGSGGAGMRAALAAAQTGDLRVALMTKIFPTRSATGMAQGGINGVMQHADPGDTLEKHIFDTVKGSDFLGDQDAIEFFCRNMPAVINELDYLGVPFSRDARGRIAQRNFCGQSSPRTCYSADKTGHVILHTMYAQCLKHGVQILQEWQLLDLVTDNGRLCGVVAWEIKTGRIMPVAAKAVVIATGGVGRIYWLRTTNPFISTGDGMACCFRAGIPLKDPEMVQFHPTGLAGTGILMSEAVRGEGGYLVNRQGERFMQRYAPEKMELATRDVVAKAIETEIREGRGCGEGANAHILADLRHLGVETITEKLHGIRDLAIAFEGADPVVDPIPIRPTCHYSMGGIDVIDHRTCRTALDGVYAAGEAACVSIHGANRLGGNSLADVMIFGKVAGLGAGEFARGQDFSGEQPLREAAAAWENKFSQAVARKEGPAVAALRHRMAETMWHNVGIFRQAKEMETAQETIDGLLAEYQHCVVGDASKVYNTAFVQYVELGNLLTIAKAVVLGALNREESRGCHLREDFPARDDANFLKHTIITKSGSRYALSYRPVVVTKYPPAERSY
ncbi:MAG TPA: FAD-binding protein [Negativicutes bacterium]|nr:FAD-binding protein [Negativicutes bacterium]